MMLTTLLPKEASLIPSVYGDREQDFKAGITGSLPDLPGALWGLVTGKLSVAGALEKIDLKASLGIGRDLKADPSYTFFLEYSLTDLLKSANSGAKKVLDGVDLKLDYSKKLETKLGSITSHTSLEYKPTEKKFYIDETVTSSILKHDLDLKLLKVDLNSMKFDFTLWKGAEKLFKEIGNETYGNPTNPAKPETLGGSSSGSTNSSEPIEWDNLNGFGLQSCAVNDTDPTELDCEGSSTLSPTVGGIVVPVDKFGLLAPYIGLASKILAAAVAPTVYVKRVKRRKEKQ